MPNCRARIVRRYREVVGVRGVRSEATGQRNQAVYL